MAASLSLSLLLLAVVVAASVVVELQLVSVRPSLLAVFYSVLRQPMLFSLQIFIYLLLFIADLSVI